MKKFIHVYENEIVQRYKAEEPIVYGGPWGNGEAIQVPEDIELDVVKLVDGKVVADSEKIAELEAQKQAQKDKEEKVKLAKDALKAFDPKKSQTVATLTKVLESVKEILSES